MWGEPCKLLLSPFSDRREFWAANWSPMGDRIAYITREDNTELIIMNTNEMDTEVLLSLEFGHSVFWVP